MTHEDAGHYAAKHTGVTVNPEIAEELKQYIASGRITCSDAHVVAHDLQVNPSEVGIAIDLLEARIMQCQLGLFGWHQKDKNRKSSGTVPDSFQHAIRSALVDGRLPCAAAWKIAESLAITKRAVKNACDRLSIKISPCQLGAFI